MSKSKKKAAAPPEYRRDSKGYEQVNMPIVSDFNDLSGLAEAGDRLAVLIQQRNKILEEINDLNILTKALMESVKDDESWSVRSDDGDWSLSYVRPKPRETLVRELLIEQGVTLKQIQKATKVTPMTPFVTLRLPKERDDE